MKVLILEKCTPKYLGGIGHIDSNFSQMVQEEKQSTHREDEAMGPPAGLRKTLLFLPHFCRCAFTSKEKKKTTFTTIYR